MLLWKNTFFIDVQTVSLCSADELHGPMKFPILSYPKIPRKTVMLGNHPPIPPSAQDKSKFSHFTSQAPASTNAFLIQFLTQVALSLQT